jgi:pimeloyl-ACP methyl ester carboxylesterase
MTRKFAFVAYVLLVHQGASTVAQPADAPSGRVWACRFAADRFSPPSLRGEGRAAEYALPLAARVDSVWEESHAVPLAIQAFYRAPGWTGNKLSDDPSGELVTLMSDAYGRILRDRSFDGAGSALGFCVAGADPGRGHGFAYIPFNAPPNAERPRPAIVFLHGYGGNQLWNIWGMKTLFPDRVILAPSGGIAWPDTPPAKTQEYIDEMCREVEKTLHFRVEKPWLMALSQGGPTGFRLASAAPERYAGYVSIASWAEDPSSLKLPKDFPVLMVNGTKDDRVDIADARRTSEALSGRGASVSLETLDGANHFFFLGRQDEMGRLIRRFVGEHERRNPIAARDSRMSDCVGRYRWRTGERTIEFSLEADGSFSASQKADHLEWREGFGLVSDGKGTWSLEDGRLTVRMEAVHVFGLWKPHEVVWIDGEHVLDVTDEGIALANGGMLSSL